VTWWKPDYLSLMSSRYIHIIRRPVRPTASPTSSMVAGGWGFPGASSSCGRHGPAMASRRELGDMPGRAAIKRARRLRLTLNNGLPSSGVQ
jgi:hypothetical protein